MEDNAQFRKDMTVGLLEKAKGNDAETMNALASVGTAWESSLMWK